MSLPGHVINGVVVFDATFSLPEGTKVNIVPMVELPLAMRRGTGDWNAAAKAAQSLRETGYDFEAWQMQRDVDLQHATDQLP